MHVYDLRLMCCAVQTSLELETESDSFFNFWGVGFGLEGLKVGVLM